ncbi:hypothetical protein KUCAC02_031918, partial [Chaenocephalus aceratus]
VRALFPKAGVEGRGPSVSPDSVEVKRSIQEVAHVIIAVKWGKRGETSRMSHDGTDRD